MNRALAIKATLLLALAGSGISLSGGEVLGQMTPGSGHGVVATAAGDETGDGTPVGEETLVEERVESSGLESFETRDCPSLTRCNIMLALWKVHGDDGARVFDNRKNRECDFFDRAIDSAENEFDARRKRQGMVDEINQRIENLDLDVPFVAQDCTVYLTRYDFDLGAFVLGLVEADGVRVFLGQGGIEVDGDDHTVVFEEDKPRNFFRLPMDPSEAERFLESLSRRKRAPAHLEVYLDPVAPPAPYYNKKIRRLRVKSGQLTFWSDEERTEVLHQFRF